MCCLELPFQVHHSLLVVEFSLQSESSPSAGGLLDRGAAEGMAGRTVQDHKAGPLGLSDKTAPSP